MQTNQAIGIYNGLAPDDKGPVVRCQIIDLDANGAIDWNANGGDGSAVMASQAFQTIFIDNSLGANNLTIKCVGTNFTFKAPKNTQGYYPLVCANGSYGFSISGGTSLQKFEVAVFNVMLPSAIWTIA